MIAKKPKSRMHLPGLRMTARLANVGYRLDGKLDSSASYETFVADPEQPCKTVIAPIIAILVRETSYSCAKNMRADFAYLKNYVASIDVERAISLHDAAQQSDAVKTQ